MSRVFVLLPLLSGCCMCPCHEGGHAEPIGATDDVAVADPPPLSLGEALVTAITYTLLPPDDVDAPAACHATAPAEAAAPEPRHAAASTTGTERHARAERRSERAGVPAAETTRPARARPPESRGRPTDDSRASRRAAAPSREETRRESRPRADAREARGMRGTGRRTRTQDDE